MKFTQNLCLAAVTMLAVCGCSLAQSYGAAPAASSYGASSSPVYVSIPAASYAAAPSSSSYGAQAAQTASYGSAPASSYASNQYQSADATASVVNEIAAAQASSAKLNGLNWQALNNYGYQIGVPLLVKNYGALTNLYSAVAPQRSFVGTIDAGFYKDSYGNIKFRDQTSVGAIKV